MSTSSLARAQVRLRSRSNCRRSRWSARRLALAFCPARCATDSGSPHTSTSTTATSCTSILTRSAQLLDVPLEPDGAVEIAGRSRGTPRVANRLLRRVRDFAEVRGTGVVDLDTASAALAIYDVDAIGLDRLDRSVLESLVRKFGGGPVGLGTLAVAVGEERETVEEVAEPYLVRAGLLARTPRGRIATPAAWEHLGMTYPTGGAAAGTQSLFDATDAGGDPGPGRFGRVPGEDPDG